MARATLITGGQGFIGSWIAERLLADDPAARVVVPVRAIRPEARFWTEGIGDGARVVEGADLTDPAAVEALIDQHDIEQVFHLAAETVATHTTIDPHATIDFNVRGTLGVLEAARRARTTGRDTRVVVASTYHVYGAQPDAVPFTEDLALRPVSPYAVSKASADMFARSYAASYAMPVAVTRLANVYGGGDSQGARLVADLASALAAGRTPVIRSDGTPERDFIYAADAVDAYLAVARSLDRPEHWGRAWNAGAGAPVAIADLAQRLIAASGQDVEPEITGTPSSESGPADRQYLDSAAIARELGWQPSRDLDGGLAETYAWYERAVARSR